MKFVLITGANRGIGFELTKQCLSLGHTVIATMRSTLKNELFSTLPNSQNLILETLDVNSCESVSTLFSKVRNYNLKIDWIFNNAGIIDWSSIHEVDAESFRDIYETNVIGAFRVLRGAIKVMNGNNNSLIINLSSRLGSIHLRGETQLGGAIAYQCSKASLNMLTKQASIDLAEHGIKVISVSPGWVRTDMGGSDAKYEVEESVKLLLAQINQLPKNSNGIFLGEDGNEIPW